MKYLLALFGLTYSGIAFSQIDTSKGDIVLFIEVMPEFPGGTKAMMKFLNRNIEYPTEARKNKVEGKVIVQFIVNKDGAISDVQLLRGLEPSCDAEAIRVIQSMPKWHPALTDNKPQRCYFKMPITFKL